MEKFLFCGGGTGGHIYPAIAVANSIKAQNAKAEFLFVGSNKGIDASILQKSEYPFQLIHIGPINGVSRVRQLFSLLQLVIAIFHCMWIIQKFKASAVIGFGGFVSGPMMIAALILRKKTAIWEANAAPGLVNRKLGKYIGRAYLSFTDKNKIFKDSAIRIVGTPSRFSAKKNDNSNFDSKHRALRILVFGGSQGARALNECIVAYLQSIMKKESKVQLEQIEILHQTGQAEFEKFQASYVGLPNTYVCQAYVHDMDAKLAWADLVICRSGASTINEISICAKAAILVPLPWAADNHQYHNAMQLVEQNAAILLEQKSLNIKVLDQKILELIENPKLLIDLQNNIKKLAKPDAAKNMANDLMAYVQ